MSLVRIGRDMYLQNRRRKLLWRFADGEWKNKVKDFPFLSPLADHLIDRGLFLGGRIPWIQSISVRRISPDMLNQQVCSPKYDMCQDWPNVSAYFLVVKGELWVDEACHPHFNYETGSAPMVKTWLLGLILKHLSDCLLVPNCTSGKKPLRLEDVTAIVAVTTNLRSGDYEFRKSVPERGFDGCMTNPLPCDIVIYKGKRMDRAVKQLLREWAIHNFDYCLQ